MGGLPDRWMDYRPMGRVIPGTRFIAFKVPLKEALCQRLQKEKWFTPQHIINDKPNISLIVDLTNTERYYDKNIFQKANKSYVKIFCPGHVIPTKQIVSKFFESVDKFLSEHPDDETLIGVHCTHGVNRTGYFICKYMIDKMGIEPSNAIADVGQARGYPIERQNYLQDLKGEEVTAVASSHKRANQTVVNWKDAARPDAYLNDRSSQDDRVRTNWMRDDMRDSRRDGKYNQQFDNPRYRDGIRSLRRSPGRFRDIDSGRNHNRNNRYRPYEKRSSRGFSSDRYNRPRSRSRYDDRRRNEDRPNRGPR